jgi:hypothetical protein
VFGTELHGGGEHERRRASERSVFRKKRAVDTVHGVDGAGLSDWFPLSQVQMNAARKGNVLEKQAVTHWMGGTE